MTATVEQLVHNCPTCGRQMVQRYKSSRFGKQKKGGWLCHPCNRRKINKYRIEQPDKILDTRLWAHYRIRFVDYQRMLEEQNHCCAACGKPAAECDGNRAWSRLVVDHDHSCCESKPLCGKCVRALICAGCNVALGHAGDSVEHLEKLITYLKRYQ